MLWCDLFWYWYYYPHSLRKIVSGCTCLKLKHVTGIFPHHSVIFGEWVSYRVMTVALSGLIAELVPLSKDTHWWHAINRSLWVGALRNVTNAEFLAHDITDWETSNKNGFFFLFLLKKHSYRPVQWFLHKAYSMVIPKTGAVNLVKESFYSHFIWENKYLYNILVAHKIPELQLKQKVNGRWSITLSQLR